MKRSLFRLNQRGGLVAEIMTSSLRRREELILGNSILVSAIYIDPLSRILLTEDQKEKIPYSKLLFAWKDYITKRRTQAKKVAQTFHLLNHLHLVEIKKIS